MMALDEITPSHYRAPGDPDAIPGIPFVWKSACFGRNMYLKFKLRGTNFTPFLLHLAGSGLTKKTIQKHVDNLWVLGGEIIRDLQETPKLRKKPINQLIDTLLEDDGPLIYHCDSEEQQRSFESTCRKLRRYLAETVSDD